jgi:hypothetical protein
LDAIIVFYSLICFSFDFFRSKPIFWFEFKVTTKGSMEIGAEFGWESGEDVISHLEVLSLSLSLSFSLSHTHNLFPDWHSH